MDMVVIDHLENVFDSAEAQTLVAQNVLCPFYRQKLNLNVCRNYRQWILIKNQVVIVVINFSLKSYFKEIKDKQSPIHHIKKNGINQKSGFKQKLSD